VSGIAAWFATGDGMPAHFEAVRFAGPESHQRTYRDPGLALFVAGRLPGAGSARSFGELVESGRYVLACEGYLFDLPDPDVAAGERPARGETLLDRFRRHGVQAFEMLRGGFTLIVWDRVDRVAHIAVCRYGQRSLYRASTRDGVVFASDLELLRQLCGRRFELDHGTLWMSLLYGGIPGTDTPLEGVTKVLPGTTISVRAGAVMERLATEMPRAAEAADPRTSKAAHLDALDGRMAAAVRRLAGVANAPALMMGSGVDSAVVGAYAREAVDGLVAITQRMPGALDETAGAERSVAALGVRHVIVPYRPSDGELLLREVARFVRIAGEPAYWNQLGPPLLRLLATLPERPTAFLTGAEGDHLFYFRSARRPSLVRVIRQGVFRSTARYTARRLLNRVTRRSHIVASDFDLLNRELLREHLAVELPDAEDGAGRFYPAYAHLSDGPNAVRHFINNAWQNVRIISQLAREAGAEALFPYLDDAVAAYLLALPDELKIDKILLRLLLSRRLPRHLVPRRKMGYWAHTIRWHHENRALGPVLDLLSEPRTLQRGIVDAARVRTLVDGYGARRIRHHHHPVLWQLLLFEVFCRELVDPPHPGSR
jgi:asparagine synthase (glutamine-hydrolysing)